jgi:serine protease Do
MKCVKKAFFSITISFTFLIFVLLSGCAYLPITKLNSSTTQITDTSTVTAPVTQLATTSTWTLPNTNGQNQILPDFVSVVAKVRPSVVAINVEATAYDIFNRRYTSEGAGSGWIIDSKGLIVTNNHVIEGATKITVTMEDGSTVEATVLGADSVADLAVLKIDRTGLPTASIGDSTSIKIGEWVVAIGNALGEGISATQGIVSRSGASVTVDTNQTLYDLIQTSAAINPGNSGGPLVNMKGEVVGITSAKLAAVGVEGMGYAISTKTAIPIIQSLVQKGYVIRPYLGVRMETVNQWSVMRYGLGIDRGALLDEVINGSPAAQAGMQTGDVIVKFNNTDINTAQDAQQAIRSAQVGQNVQIVYWRGNTKYTIQVVMIETPAS